MCEHGQGIQMVLSKPPLKEMLDFLSDYSLKGEMTKNPLMLPKTLDESRDPEECSKDKKISPLLNQDEDKFTLE